MDQNRQFAFSVLGECIAMTDKKEEAAKESRLDDLLAKFTVQTLTDADTVECATGWHFCVRPSFRAAIDIKKTPRKIGGKTEMKWTQGSWFHFKKGDTLYDSPRAYLPWDLYNFGLCIDVTSGMPAQPPNGDDRIERNPGTVAFNLLAPDASRTQLVLRAAKTMTQDDFVRMLIGGPPSEWGLL